VSSDDSRPENRVLVDAAEIEEFVSALFASTGMRSDDARLAADQLVLADLRGVESHGVVRVPIYLARLRAGAIAARPAMRVARESRSTAVLDGGNGMGQVVGARAMALAIDKSKRENEPAFVAVRNSNHFGAAAWFAEEAARADLIGFAFTIGGINHMVPWGGAEAMLGNNPFAIAFPLRGEAPVVLDMACSVAARGKIIVAAKEGRPIPAGWAVDRDGVPTTDARAALDGFVAPVGGPKGYALTLAIGLLSTMLSDAYFGTEVTHMYDDLGQPQNIGHLFGALPIAAFESLERYDARMAKAAAELRGVRLAPSVDRIWLPGEREAELERSRRREGLPIGRNTFDDLVVEGRRAAIASPRVRAKET
jgi:LDH2 family malate/lactate/ureidoglycolate dehydrogenase